MVDINGKIKNIEKYAKINNIPIMQKEGIDFLTDFIKKHNVRSILEIGTAIGYSAIKMTLVSPNINATSIERDGERYLKAVDNINDLGLSDRITLIYKDALEVKLDGKYSLIFIDAAKAQNIKFFEKFKYNLAPNGYIITDNMNFHGLALKDEKDIESKNVRGIVRKIKEYKKFLIENKEFETEFIEKGDGIAVTRRKEDNYDKR